MADQQKLQQAKQFVTNFLSAFTQKSLPDLKTYLSSLQQQINNKSNQFFSETNSITDLMNTTFQAKHKTCMHFAAAKGDLEIFKYIVETYHPDLSIQDKQHHTPLETAVAHRHLNILKYLVQNCAQNVNEVTEGRSGALHKAANNNDLQIINYLLDHGANIQQKSDFAAPLNWAVGSGSTEAALLLLDRGAHPDGDLTTPFPPPLIVAIDFGNEVLYNKLIQKGANLNIHDTQGYSVLQLAAQKGNLKLVEYLVGKGADVDYQCEGKTALYLAFENSKWEVIQYLRKFQKDFQALQAKIQASKQNSPVGLTTQQITTRSNAFKQEGNKLFADKKYQESIVQYSKAIQVDPNNHILYSNRAASNLALKQFDKSLIDSVRAKEICPTHCKSIYREAQSYAGLGNFVEAAASYWQASKLEPNNKELMANFKKYVELARQNK